MTPLLRSLVLPAALVAAVTQPEFDCTARQLAYEQATVLLGAGPLASGLKDVHDALQLGAACNAAFDAPPFHTPEQDNPRQASTLATLHVATTGDDASADGTPTKPFASIRAARDAARARNDGSAGQVVGTVAIGPGRYELDETLTLGPEDNGMTFEGAGCVLSGGVALSLELKPVVPTTLASLGLPPGTMQTKLPARRFRMSALYEDTSSTNPREGLRLPWARTPNGQVETDLQPQNLAKARGQGSTQPGPSENGSLYSIVATPRRNNSVYPIWGRDFDPRDRDHSGNIVGWQWHHVGGTSRRFGDDVGFFNGTVATSMKYGDPNETIGANCSEGIGGVVTGGQCRKFSPFVADGWTSAGASGGIAHVFHDAFWGNWQFEIESIDAESQDIIFKQGGFQEGHGGGIGSQPFFIEGVREALDAKGEWWVDEATDTMYMLPNTTSFTTETGDPSTRTVAIKVVAPQLQTLVSIRGAAEDPAGGSDGSAANITLRGLAFSHAAPTYLEPYVVPSPGDWSVHRGGAIVIEGAEGTTIANCSFVRLGGNAIALTGHAWHTTITESEFFKIGDSAIVSVGDFKLNDGVSSDAYPLGTMITGNHFHEIGVTGKQTSALFSATSCRSTFRGNVAYNGPRAGINLNDAFCHGHTIEHNLLFNWVRETQDHGPINTWNRAAYMHVGKDGNPTDVPEWTHISQNFIMNGPTIGHTSSLFPFVDNDDGSAYFSIVGNVGIYGGGKNYLGHDKRWAHNLIIFPDHWAGDPCVQIWGGPEHHFVGNECVVGRGTGDGCMPGCAGQPLPDPIGLDSGSTGGCKVDWNNASLAPNIGHVASNTYWTQDGGWSFGCGNATSEDHRFTMAELQAAGQADGSVVKKAGELTVAALGQKVRTLLKLPASTV